MIACFESYCDTLAARFLEIRPVEVRRWQSLDISSKPEMMPRAIWNEVFQYRVPLTLEQLAEETRASFPWAEDHFQERIGGKPLNPPPSEAWWPYAQQGNQAVKTQGAKFSHTYPERFWPKWAGDFEDHPNGAMYGIRFKYGDFGDVINQLNQDPTTRQAFLPIFFPEDTGAVHGERVPCTLGYQFNIDHGRLLVTYFIRSCDFVRHFRDDVYMAGRLGQFIASCLNVAIDDIILTMHIVNFHVFEGDVVFLKNQVSQSAYREAVRLSSLL